MIELRDFSTGYSNRTLLQEANVSLTDGTLTALIGRNGSGKSTLLRAIAGLNSNYTGEIKLDSHNLQQMKPQQLARVIAFVNTERTRIASLRCEDVVAMGRAPYTNWIGRLQPVDNTIVAHALEAVGMADYARRTMDTMSDGECQRIMIARALAQATPTIVLDEPTSFLDLPGRYELVALLRKLAHDEGKCVLFSTHELDIAIQLCDNIALLDTPRLRYLPTEEMRASGYIDRLFQNNEIRFDTNSGTVKLKETL